MIYWKKRFRKFRWSPNTYSCVSGGEKMSVQILAATTAKAQSISDANIKFVLIGGGCLNVLLFIAMIYLIYRLVQVKKNSGKITESAVRQRPKKLAEQSVGQVIEKQILNLASVRGGTLSVVETAYYTKLSIEISERALDSFATRGYAEITDENGAQLYHFQGILTEYEKVTAKSLNDLLEEKI
jgi:hypothetical protein